VKKFAVKRCRRELYHHLYSNHNFQNEVILHIVYQTIMNHPIQ